MSVKPLKFDENGLIVAVAQDRLTGEVRMVAWMNQAAIDRTLETKRATFYSRSRKRLWEKGEESGNFLHVQRVVADCDGDTLLLQVDPVGPSCHTGQKTCFFERLSGTGTAPVEPFIAELERVISSRQASTEESSYTKSLFSAGAEKIGAKLREEADELANAVGRESRERVVSEAADVVFHLLVGLKHREAEWHQVMEVLASRFGVSGHDEKRGRKPTKGA